MHAIALQQTPPFRYVDDVAAFDGPARRAHLSLDLDQGQARFGHAEHLPGYLLIEAMAQACGVLLRGVTAGDNGGYLVGIEDAVLPSQVDYPARLDISVALGASRPPFFGFDAQVRQAERTVAQARLQVMSRREFT